MGISLTEPTIKKEKKKTADGEEYEVFCVCVYVENDGNQAVQGDISFWAYAPGAPTPVKGILCTKSNIKIPGKKVKMAGGVVVAESKGREEVCCCDASHGIVAVFNGRGRIMAAWGKKDDKGEVTIEKAEETKGMSKPVKLP